MDPRLPYGDAEYLGDGPRGVCCETHDHVKGSFKMFSMASPKTWKTCMNFSSGFKVKLLALLGEPARNSAFNSFSIKPQLPTHNLKDFEGRCS